MAKLLGRRLTGVANPVLAKRRTAMMKSEAAQRHKRDDAVTAAKARKTSRRAHLADPAAAFSVVKEKELKRVATKGVVALFNAIRKQQRTAEGDGEKGVAADPEEAAKRQKRAKVASKQSFLALLKQSTQSAGASAGAGEEVEKGEQGVVEDEDEDDDDDPLAATAQPPARKSSSGRRKKWAALDDDFMHVAKVKDWDLEGSDVESDGAEWELEEA